MSRTTSFGLVALAAAMLVATPSVQAQSLTIPSTSPVATQSAAPALEMTAPVGPVVDRVGISRNATAPALESAIQSNPNRRDVAWMVLGGATLIVGSIVGGDGGTILMVTGGVIGLVGLWRYLQYS